MTSPASYVEMFSVDAMVPVLQATERSDALAEMVGAAISGNILPRARRQQVLDSLSDREARGTTGLGGGIAIPHAKIDGLRKHCGVVARSGVGVDFRAIDGEPVHVIVMLISPASRAEEHLEVLRWISMVARDPDFTSFIRQAQSAQDMFEVLQERSE